jgi:hypothetical protein
VSNTDVSASNPLKPGQSINVEFEFQVPTTGSFQFAYNAEDDLVPVPGSTTPTNPTAGPAANPAGGAPANTDVTGTLTPTTATTTTTRTTPATTTAAGGHCQAAIASLRVTPGRVAGGHAIRLHLRMRHVCETNSRIVVSSTAFAHAHHVTYTTRRSTFTVTIAIPKARKPGRYTITARTTGSAAARTSLKVTH